MKRLRVAVIGAGSWGRNHVRTVASLAEAELVAVCDVDEGRRTALQRQYPAALITGSADEAIGAAEAVVVATPAVSHAALALAAIRKGLPVLVEKPFALSVQDAESMQSAAAKAGVPVLVGHLLLFHPAVERLRDMVRSGELGDLYYMYGQRVNLGQVRPDENALWSFGPHDVSVALYVLGEEPVRVVAYGRSYLQPKIEDVVFLVMEFKSGALAHVQMSWLDPQKERRLTIVGSRRMVVFDDMQPREKLKIYDKGIDRPPEYQSYGESLTLREGDISIPRLPSVEPLLVELRHFVAVAQRREEPRANASSGVAVVRVLEAASRSLASGGQPVAL
ncbi:MAG TPA: Gfo/Idh/MocA family oxidoreductase [Gemmatimonadales bacterium]